ncbi:hypothetical protein LTS18_002237, partial [Coniosporium uncinatum]
DWEICVPAEQLQDAVSLLTSEERIMDYPAIAPRERRQPRSLAHTYHRFSVRGWDCTFILVPSNDIHLSYEPAHIQRSLNGLPYPRLDVFVQSLLDTYNIVALCDVVDGTDVSLDWGSQHLDLAGTNDVQWAIQTNSRLRDLCGGNGPAYWIVMLPTGTVKKSNLWEDI